MTFRAIGLRRRADVALWMRQGPVETRPVSSVARHAGLVDEHEQAVGIAIVEHVFDLLRMPAALAFFPDSLLAS